MSRDGKRLARVLAAVAAAALAGTPARAYYQYIHYQGRSAPFTPIPEAFDLNALSNKTIAYFVGDTGPATYGTNDDFGATMSQVKQAAAAWNSVASSDLRLAFGGLENSDSPANAKTPGIDVVFEELPPGLLGMGAPTVAASASVQTGQNGPFIAIARGTVYLTNNTTYSPTEANGPGPSYLEEFFTTAVHEFGHALGLQHTWTSAAMSQDVIRNTSRARPLDADDMAAISVLYGKAGWAANFGSISGKVTLAGNGNPPAVLASVVAIPPVGPAVSALTNPDGTYTISGLPPNQYLLYVHPLPPDAILPNNLGIVVPVDANGQAFSGPSIFQTLFYPATLDPTQATTFTIAPGTALTNENFTVQGKSSVPVYDIITWSYLDPNAREYTYAKPSIPVLLPITPAFVDITNPDGFMTIVARAAAGSTPLPQSVTVLGGAFSPALPGSAGTLKPLPSEPGIAAYFYVQSPPGIGPRHLVFNFGNDIYVLPDAINLVQKGPPRVDAVAAGGPGGGVTLTGAGFGPDSRVFFDGLQANISAPFSGADVQGSISVVPPAGGEASVQTSTITVFNSDGQNSMFLLNDTNGNMTGTPPNFSYAAIPLPQIATVNPASLPAGSNSDGVAATIDITTLNTNFVNGQVMVGFGSSDVSVRRVWALSPTHLVADVVVVNGATVDTSEISVVSGLQVMAQQSAFQIQPANLGPQTPTIALPIVNATTYLPSLHSGDYASIYGSNLALSPGNTQVTLSGTQVQLQQGGVLPNQINFLIPANFPAGPAILNLNNGSAGILTPIYVQIEGPQPQIASIANSVSAAAVDATHAASPGDLLNLQVNNVDLGVVNAASRVQVTIAGVPMPVEQITAPQGGGVQIQIAVSQSFAGVQVPVVVSVDGSASTPFLATVR